MNRINGLWYLHARAHKALRVPLTTGVLMKASPQVLSAIILVLLVEASLIYINQSTWRAAATEPSTTPNLDWVNAWGGTKYESANAVTTHSGAIYVAGRTLSFGDGLSNIFLLKYTGDGELAWNRTWGGPSYNGCFGITADDEGLYIAGYTYIEGNNNANVAILKYDFDGNLEWARTWGGAEDAVGRGVTLNGNGAVYVTGYLRGNTTTKSSFLLKYDESGKLAWNRTFGVEGVNALSVGVGDGVYVGGTNENIKNGTWRSQMFLTKFDEAGSLLWSHEWGSNPVNDCWAVSVNGETIYQAGTTVDASGIYHTILLGYYPSGSLRFNVIWGKSDDNYVWGISKDSDYVYLVGYIGGTGSSNDVLVSKFSANGSQISNVTWGGKEADAARSVAVEGNNFYVSGMTYSYGKDSQAFTLKYTSVNKVTSLGASLSAAAATGIAVIALTVLFIKRLERTRNPIPVTATQRLLSNLCARIISKDNVIYMLLSREGGLS